MSLSKIVWQTRKLGEVANIFNGNSINENEKKEKYLGLKSGTPYISTKDIEFDNKIDFENGVLIPKDQAHKFKIVEANSVLICAEGGSAGRKFAHTNRNIFFGNKLFALTSNNKIDSKFVFYFYQSEEFCSLFRSKMSGLIGGVSINKFKEIEIPLPPIDEQKRIVKILDEVFLGLAKAKETTEKNLKNAREVFESYLQSVFKDSANGLVEKELGTIVDFQNGFAFKSKDELDISNTQLIRMGNLYNNNLDLDRRPVYYPDNFCDIYKKFLLKEGDLIISLTGTTGKKDYGFTVKVPKSDKNLLLNQRIAKVVILDECKTSKDYLLFFLLSKTFLDRLYKTANGTRQANLSTDAIKRITIKFPSLSEQNSIVAKLDALSAETKKLEELYKQKLTHLEELKKSILKKAFNGEL